MSHGDILRSIYVNLICSNLILAPGNNLNPVEGSRFSVDSVLLPVTCSCKKKCTAIYQCSNFEKKRTLELSLPIDSVEHWIT